MKYIESPYDLELMYVGHNKITFVMTAVAVE